MNNLEKYNFPLNKLEYLSITYESIYVFKSDIQKFLSKPIDLIPNNSPYHIETKLRNQSDLDELAVIAYQYYIEEKNDEKLKDKLISRLGYSEKKAKEVMFFLSPDPKGNQGKLLPKGCQFPYLTYAATQFWEKQPLNGKVNPKVKQFLTEEGFTDDKIKYGEIVVRKNKGTN